MMRFRSEFQSIKPPKNLVEDDHRGENPIPIESEGAFMDTPKANMYLKALETLPEAREWLRDPDNGFAGNAFATNDQAIEFVNELYEAGAMKVVIYDAEEKQTKVGSFAEMILFSLPSNPDQRRKLFAISNREYRDHEDTSENAFEDNGQPTLAIRWG